MKFAKLSLVAAVAVAGFTTANAQPLEEAIKNVDVSGSAVYRYNDYKSDVSNNTASSNNYKIGLNVSSKVNDDVKFNTRFLVANPSVLTQAGTTSANSVVTGNNNGFTALDTGTISDQNIDVQLSQANFAYTGLKNTTVTVGKQGLNTPYTTGVMIDENEQNGTGAMVLSAVGPVTLGAAYFNQTNLDKSGELASTLNGLSKRGNAGTLDITALAAIATLGPVTADAWYLDMQELFDTYTVGAKAETKLGDVTLGATARYASLDLDASSAKNDIIKAGLSAKVGIFNASADYAKTNKEGGITGLDSDAVTVLKGWNISTLDKFDADYYKLVAGVDILANLNLSANYGDLKSKASASSTAADIEEEELYGQLTYKMSKNLTTYVRYGTYTKDYTPVNSTSKIDDTRGRLQVAYTF